MNRVIVGDCISLLAKIRDKSVDLVFADPPYNLMLKSALRRPDGSKVIGVSEDWDKFESFAAYDQFTRAWLKECRRILKPTGSIVVIGSYHNIFRLGVALQDLGFWIQNDIVWRKTNPTPNFAGKRLTNAHETMIWASPTSAKASKFNYKALKSGNDDAQLRSDWLMPICQGAERLRDGEGKSIHPTQKPLRLIERVIVMTTDEGDVVIDPFSGTGTTGVASIHLKRQFLGFERDENYADAANRRLGSTRPYSISPAQEPAPVKYPTMIDLVGAGAIAVGDLLEARTRTGTIEARVLSTGELTTATQKGSIHMLARDLGVPQSNGWLAWTLVRGSARISIDQIRKGGTIDRLTPLVPLTPTDASAEQIRRPTTTQRTGSAPIPRPIATVQRPAFAPALSVLTT